MDSITHYLPNEHPLIIITDDNVRHYYENRFPPAETIITIGTGEANKTLDTVQMIYERLVSIEAERSIFLLGIGGGIVCDITGFAASTYMRGVRFGYVPTTLLAQVDAGVGGKTGFNFMGYKNMIGTFNQPELVVCDPAFFPTLSPVDLSCGFAEIIKHAAIADHSYFEMLEKFDIEQQMNDSGVVEDIVYRSVVIKADIVNRDERERGERRKLNFGHTLGHALEKTIGMPHGEAVGIGMMAAANLSFEKKLLIAKDVLRLKKLLESFHLPTAVDVDVSRVMDAFARDKKKEGKVIHFVLLNGIGKAVIESIRLDVLEKVLFNKQTA